MITINGKQYNLTMNEMEKIGREWLRNLFLDHLPNMSSWHLTQLDRDELRCARKLIESDEDLKAEFLESVLDRFTDDEVLDTICEDAIYDMNLDLDEEEDEENDH